MSSQEDVISSSQEDIPSPIMSQETFRQIEGELPLPCSNLIIDTSNFSQGTQPNNPSQELSSKQYTLLGSKGQNSALRNHNDSNEACSKTSLAHKGKGFDNFDTQEETTSLLANQSQLPIYCQGFQPRQQSTETGRYSFNIGFSENNQPTKSTTCTYSKLLNKLFVNFYVPCPIKFFVDPFPPEGSYIRATAYFRDPAHVNSVVVRCLTHQADNQETNIGFSYIKHVIRCQEGNAIYQEHATNGRLSVLVPCQRPDPLIGFQTLNYVFVCYSSCIGGMNRRAIDVVFTLEHKGVELGRKSVEVRICACPGRDRIKCELKKTIKNSEVEYKTGRPIENEVTSSTICPRDACFASTSRTSAPVRTERRENDVDEPCSKLAKFTNDNCLGATGVAARNAINHNTDLVTVSVQVQVQRKDAATLQRILDGIKMATESANQQLQAEGGPRQEGIPEVLLSDEEIKKESQD